MMVKNIYLKSSTAVHSGVGKVKASEGIRK